MFEKFKYQISKQMSLNLPLFQITTDSSFTLYRNNRVVALLFLFLLTSQILCQEDPSFQNHSAKTFEWSTKKPGDDQLAFDDAEIINIEEGSDTNQFQEIPQIKKKKRLNEKCKNDKDHFKRYLQIATPLTDTNCPKSEPYIAYANIYQNGAKFKINDIKLRKLDRMQYVTGYYRENFWDSTKCFIAKITSRGDFEEGKRVDGGGSKNSECKAIALVPETNNVVAVGWKSGDLSGNVQALLIYTDSSLNLIGVKEFHVKGSEFTTSVDIIAYDVAVAEADGSIFVTGELNGGHTRSVSGKDCFVLRLDQSLNRIYAKSFGITKTIGNANLQCKSIQVTRNSDYIYVGGEQDNGLFITKMSSNLNKMSTSTLFSKSTTEKLTMRRLILEQDVPLNNNQKIYFCGFTDSNSGDMLFGYATSTNLHVDPAPQITINQVFQYGSTDTESVGMGDCKLTNDNKYFVGLLTTNHGQSQPTATPAFNRINQWSYAYSYKFSNYGVGFWGYNPWYNSNNWGTCSQNTLAAMFSAANLQNIRDWCETTMQSEIETYAQNYNKYLYSWRTCTTYFIYYLQSAYCNIGDYRYSGCSIGGGTQSLTASGFTCSANSLCDEFVPQFNSNRLWYSNYNLGAGCADIQFRSKTWDRIFLQSTGQGYIDSVNGFYTTNSLKQYMFCEQQGAVACGGAPTFEQDRVDFAFDQDCTDSLNYANWFIFKFQTSKFTSAFVDSIPELAVNFGDVAGQFEGHALAIDQYGYIYVHGNTNSNTYKGNINGGSFDILSWVHAKTHWEMTYEASCLYDSTLNPCSDPQFLGIRFKIPNQYRNNQGLPLFKTFMKNFYTPGLALSLGTVATSVSLDFPYEFNRETVQSPNGWEGYYTDLISRFSYKAKTGESFVRMNYLQDIKVYKPNVISGNSNKFIHSYNLNDACVMRDTTQYTWQQEHRKLYLQKEALVEEALSIPGFTVNTVNPNSADFFSLTGDLTSSSITEGIFYFSVRVSTQSFDIKSTNFMCDQDKYGYFWNDKDFPQLRRFETSQRIRIVMDLESVKEPAVTNSMVNFSPIVRQLATISSVDSYFSNCDRYYARQVKKNLNSWRTATINYDYYQLPYWINFHEANKTFSMYVPDTSNKISIEVKCCNSIEQCAYTTFYLNPIDNPPSNDLKGRLSNYVLSYDPDPASQFGEGFQWAKKSTYFYDIDVSSDASDATYHKTDHKVDLDFIGGTALSVTNRYRYLLNNGLAFWKGYDDNFGPNTLQYQYSDLDSSTTTVPQKGSISVYVNKIPYRTTLGRKSTLQTLDPCENEIQTDYFDKWLPFLKNNDAKKELSISLSDWFAQTDKDQMTYQQSYSDKSNSPDWIKFDPILGKVSGFPMREDSSELLNLRFSATDTYSGSATLFKSLLVNCVPIPLVTHKYLVFGLNRRVKFNLMELAKDLDNDGLTFSLAQSSDENRLKAYGLVFQDTGKTISGKTLLQGTLPFIKVIASDVHGAYVQTYLTIKIDNFKPVRRIANNQKLYADHIEVVAGQPFQFPLPDNLFTDPNEDSPLVFFASNDADSPLPSWIQFYPQSRVFYGNAPISLQEQRIRVHVMHPLTHDSLSFIFTLKVITNTPPKLNMKNMGSDVEVNAGSWWQYQIKIDMFTDKEWTKGNSDRYNLQLYGQKRTNVPKWVQINPVNRTIMGWIDINMTPGSIIEFEIVYKDQQGKESLANFQLKILPPLPNKIRKVILLMALTFSCFVGLSVFIGYLYSYHSELNRFFKPSDKEIHSQSARKRFFGYLDVNIRLQPRNSNQQTGMDKNRYEQSQIGRRVLGRKGGIKFIQGENQKQIYQMMAVEPHIITVNDQEEEKQEETVDDINESQQIQETEQSLVNGTVTEELNPDYTQQSLRIKSSRQESRKEDGQSREENRSIIDIDDGTIQIDEEQSRIASFIKRHLRKTVATKPQ